MVTRVIDGNEAAAQIAYKLSEVIAIYPITPASAMGEYADAWANIDRKKNLFGSVPEVVEMQSEGGAAGAVHGALQAGSLATTFTASQGLLLMIPNMYKIAGELTSAVIHVAARTLATHALSIFGDHSDVMAVRQTGFAMLVSSSVQEAHDLALVAHAATLKARVPFLHFFDGFRTSHELNKVELLPDEVLRQMIDPADISAHRARALSPDHPVLRGTAQNPDVFFQAREACNPFYDRASGIVDETLERFAKLTGRRYRPFEYAGHPEAERVIVLMGSGAETAKATAAELAKRGERVGVVQVRLYRPFSVAAFLAALPPTVRSIAVLDRTKEPGAVGEPLFLDVGAALLEGGLGGKIRVVGGRYGLSSKEFTPAMVARVFAELAKETPKRRFTVGIEDDVTHLSLTPAAFSLERDDEVRALFFGLGSDGTVGACKSSIQIIGENTDRGAQGYFVYDSKKSGALTVSHLRFGPRPIEKPYLIERASFVACHHPVFLERFDVLEKADPGAVFLLNLPIGDHDDPARVWAMLPPRYQRTIREKDLKVYAIDAVKVAKAAGLGPINTIMQACFFELSGVLPKEEAIARIKDSIHKAYGKKGRLLIERNVEAVDRAIAGLVAVPPGEIAADPPRVPGPPEPDFVKRVVRTITEGHGDLLPVSAFPVDGTFPTATARYEKRDIALEVPRWAPSLCIECGKCAMVCPHAAIRTKVADQRALKAAPAAFQSLPFKGGAATERYIVQLSPDDCTGCRLCVEVCPGRDKKALGTKSLEMVEKETIQVAERANFDFFTTLPEADPKAVGTHTIKGAQLLEPLFEFSGACSGCGETPYLKLVSQLFGDRMLVANATGCSSIYGGNLPTTPWSTNKLGRGPAWSNSLFEDNAEFGLGMRVAVDQQREQARALLAELSDRLPAGLADRLGAFEGNDPEGLTERRQAVAELKRALERLDEPKARQLVDLADVLVDRSVWIIGGDGWAYDIGFGGLDHVLASGRKVNILVLDTEVYSNTGGQMSKATPKGAVAKFAAAGKRTGKKDLALMALGYKNVYVARIAMGASDQQTLKALVEAERHPGPSLVIAYSHCIAHGITMSGGLAQQKAAVQSGHWPLFRFDPEQADAGKNPMTLDSGPPKLKMKEYAYQEGRFKLLTQIRPELAEHMLAELESEAKERYRLYEALEKQHGAEAARPSGGGSASEPTGGSTT